MQMKACHDSVRIAESSHVIRKHMQEPVNSYMARLTCLMLTFRVIGSMGIVCTLILRYAAPLSKAACADVGMILRMNT